MKEHGISQLPVLDDSGRHCGIVAEIDLLNYLVQHEGALGEPLMGLIESDYATVTPHTRIQLVRSIFNDAKVVLVVEADRLLGVLTKIDLIELSRDQSGRDPMAEYAKRPNHMPRRAPSRRCHPRWEAPEPSRRVDATGVSDLDVCAKGPGRAQRLRVTAARTTKPATRSSARWRRSRAPLRLRVRVGLRGDHHDRG